MPLRYNFYFQALDGDYKGIYVGDDNNDAGYMNDAEFDMKAPSPLQMIVMSAQSETIEKVIKGDTKSKVLHIITHKPTKLLTLE